MKGCTLEIILGDRGAQWRHVRGGRRAGQALGAVVKGASGQSGTRSEAKATGDPERAPLGSSAPLGPRHSGALPFLTVATALWPDPASCAYKEVEGDPRASAGPEPPADRRPGPWARVTVAAGSASCACRASMLWPCGVCADAHKPFLISVADKQTERVLREPTKLIFLKGETLWPPHSVLTRTAAAPSHEA